MADDESTGGDDGQGASGGGVTLEQVRQMITSALGGRGGGGKATDTHDVSAQVEAAVQKVHAGQAAERARAELEARVRTLEERRTPERKPREYRPVTRRVWGADDDD